MSKIQIGYVPGVKRPWYVEEVMEPVQHGWAIVVHEHTVLAEFRTYGQAIRFINEKVLGYKYKKRGAQCT